jgi:hypothetical protein
MNHSHAILLKDVTSFLLISSSGQNGLEKKKVKLIERERERDRNLLTGNNNNVD